MDTYVTHVREYFDSDGELMLPPTKWPNGNTEYLDWLPDADIVVLMKFDHDAIDKFDTFVKSEDQYFMMMSSDLE